MNELEVEVAKLEAENYRDVDTVRRVDMSIDDSVELLVVADDPESDELIDELVKSCVAVRVVSVGEYKNNNL